MYVSRVSLVNFRNYRDVAIDLPPGLVLLQGRNAQGKSNFLEALFFLATSRSPRTSTDMDLIGPHGSAPMEGVTRVAARVQGTSFEQGIEIVLSGRQAHLEAPQGSLRKQIRVNGVPRRAMDLLGTLTVVLFRPEDLDLAAGPPSGRRRSLDILLSQRDPAYSRALQRYNRVLLQRNHLLRRIAEAGASPAELDVWDDHLVIHGAEILTARREGVDRMSVIAHDAYYRVSGEQEEMSCAYLSSAGLAGGVGGDFRERLARERRRDIALKQTTVGPHRDDLEILVDGRPAASFASRGQQRTAVLAWKLAEGAYLRESTGEDPVLLWDDMLSELDEVRRACAMEVAGRYQQVVLTTTGVELDELGERPAAWFQVEGGTLTSRS